MYILPVHMTFKVRLTKEIRKLNTEEKFTHADMYHADVKIEMH